MEEFHYMPIENSTLCLLYSISSVLQIRMHLPTADKCLLMPLCHIKKFPVLSPSSCDEWIMHCAHRWTAKVSFSVNISAKHRWQHACMCQRNDQTLKNKSKWNSVVIQVNQCIVSNRQTIQGLITHLHVNLHTCAELTFMMNSQPSQYNLG